jgi:hypothetical protein
MSIKQTTIIAVVLLFLSISACKNNDPVAPDIFDRQVTLLENNGKPWVSAGGSVVKDGFDVSDQFEGFQLTFSGNNFTTTNSLPNVWPSESAWAFHNDDIDVIERADGVLMTITLSANTLEVKFTDPQGSSGRFRGVPGDYVFVLQ